MATYDYTFKIILLGDFGVGKSSLMNCLSQQKDEDVSCCCQRGHRNEYVELEVNRGSKRILTRITDTGGQERYRSLTTSYYKGAYGCILMYDVTREDTFHNIQNWNSDLETYGPPNPVSTIVVGNKCLSPEREVTRQRGDKHADHLDLPYMEVDVESQYNIIPLFTTMVDNIMEIASRKSSIQPEISLSQRRASKDSVADRGCCAC